MAFRNPWRRRGDAEVRFCEVYARCSYKGCGREAVLHHVRREYPDTTCRLGHREENTYLCDDHLEWHFQRPLFE
jgi:hypothetical protein